MAVTENRTPRGSFQVNQRLLRGYGPLAVLAVMLILMALLVPSKPTKIEQVSAGNDTGSGTGSSVSGDDTTNTSLAPGQAASGGGTGAFNLRSREPGSVCAEQEARPT